MSEVFRRRYPGPLIAPRVSLLRCTHQNHSHSLPGIQVSVSGIHNPSHYCWCRGVSVSCRIKVNSHSFDGNGLEQARFIVYYPIEHSHKSAYTVCRAIFLYSIHTGTVLTLVLFGSFGCLISRTRVATYSFDNPEHTTIVVNNRKNNGKTGATHRKS